MLRFFSWIIFKTFPLGKKCVCLNFFQSGWWSTDALGCHLIGICRGIGDSLKYHYKYWNKSCCRNEIDQSYFCARMSTPNSLWRRLGQHYSGDKHLCDDGDERDQRTAVVFIGAAHLCVISLGCMYYFLFTVGKLIFILEILQDSVFSF